MSNQIPMPDRSDLTDAEYIACLESSIDALYKMVVSLNDKLLCSDHLVKAMLYSLPDMSMKITNATLMRMPSQKDLSIMTHRPPSDESLTLILKGKTNAQ